MTPAHRYTETITSAANPRVRAATELRDRRSRDRTRRLLVDGSREVARALDGGVRIVEAFVAADAPRDADLLGVIDRLAGTGVPLVPVAGPALGRLAYGERDSAIVAVAEMPGTDLGRLAAALEGRADPLIVVVEDPEKPGNLGAVARSADGAGAAALVAATDHGAGADPWNPNAIRASLGTVFTLPVAVAPTAGVIGWLRSRGLRILAARVQAALTVDRVDMRGPLAIAVGSEARGLGPAWLAADITGIRIPMLGRADSLNVSAAAAVLLYEALRQRGGASTPRA